MEQLHAFANEFDFTGWKGQIVGKEGALTLSGIYVAGVLYYKATHEASLAAGAKPRRPAWVKPVSTFHHGILAVFSGIWFYLMLQSWLNVCRTEGWNVCFDTDINGVHDQGNLWKGWSGFYIWIFMLSKYYEFFDTTIMMAKSYRIIFLHWFHHATVPILCMVHSYEQTVTCWTGLTFNALVHTVMYTYYTCVAAGIKVPAGVKSLVTSLQLVQFVTIMGHVSYIMMNHGFWKFPGTFASCYTIYMAYLLLFVKFFVDTYVNKTAPGAQKGKKKGKKTSGTSGSTTLRRSRRLRDKQE